LGLDWFCFFFLTFTKKKKKKKKKKKRSFCFEGFCIKQKKKEREKNKLIFAYIDQFDTMRFTISRSNSTLSNKDVRVGKIAKG
jgi:hypothetical protein